MTIRHFLPLALLLLSACGLPGDEPKTDPRVRQLVNAVTMKCSPIGMVSAGAYWSKHQNVPVAQMAADICKGLATHGYGANVGGTIITKE